MASRWDDGEEPVRQKKPKKAKEKAKHVDIAAEDSASKEPAPRKIDLYRESPAMSGCRSVECFKKLNRIDEGTYGIVYRAQEIATGEIVALKKLKLEREREGFPITSLREIHTLFLAKHKNIVNLREIVVGSTMDRYRGTI